MKLSDNKRLLDIAIRLQIYTEGVKAYQSLQFNLVAREISEVLEELLLKVRYRTLDGLSKAELNKLIFTLRKKQTEIWGNYIEVLLEQFEAFMSESLSVNRIVWATEQADLPEDKIFTDKEAQVYILEKVKEDKTNPLFGLFAITGGDDRMWSIINNQPMPANGFYIDPYLNTFAIQSQAAIEQTIRRAWANRLTVEECLNELLGEENSQGNASELQKIKNGNNAVVHTAIAHIAALVGAGVISSMFDAYMWCSVMDSHTTQICISRNKKIYRFGKGPIPPAHTRCRSHIRPLTGDDDFIDKSFYAWLARQPEAVLTDILGEGLADDLINGKLSSGDFKSFKNAKPLTLKEFSNKIKLILKS